MRSRRILLGAALLALFLFACPADEQGDGERVSNNLELQLKYETARRTLDELKERKQRGKDVHGDCMTLRLIFVKDLKRMKDPQAQELVKEIARTCQDVRPR